MVLIKTEILTSPKVLYTKSCTRNQFCFAKDTFQNTDFLAWNVSLSEKKWHMLFVKMFQVSADDEMGK